MHETVTDTGETFHRIMMCTTTEAIRNWETDSEMFGQKIIVPEIFPL